ncbi:ElyC/SanA/YdcF family protein [Agrococcus versicolor]|uniref:ElyC/SanA/YdcF family protein n=1 Tax=Agrococcus versicolor TaxID=501482 RepID=A0ABN3AY13_9MICO
MRSTIIRTDRRRRGLRASLAIPLVAVTAVALVGCTDDGGDAAPAAEGEPTVEELFDAVDNASPTAERVQALTDIAMHYYWDGGDLAEVEEEFFQGVTLHGDYDVVAEAMAQAVEIDPHDLDLRYGLASAQLLQDDVAASLETLDGILAIEPDAYEAHLRAAAYSRASGDEAGYAEHVVELQRIDPERAADDVASLDAAAAASSLVMAEDVPTDLPEQDHAFVVLGYALAEDGSMEQTLLDRLDVALEAAEAYPDSTLIVSGGVPQEGVTESSAMAEWLVEQGVDEDRILQEGLATDTVENALFSLQLAADHDVETVTVISSASHIRRAITIFDEVAGSLGPAMGLAVDGDELTNVVAMDFDSPEEAAEVTPQEQLVIYRDLLRASGVWAFPGLQR